MILCDFEERLVALNDEANAGHVLDPDSGEWRAIAPAFAAKVYAESDPISEAQALKRYPDADLQALPALA